MSPTARPWFRFYSEAADSIKIHELPDRLVKPWLIMLCVANVNTPRGSLPSIDRIAFKLRVKEDKAQALLDELVKRRLIDFDGGAYVMHEWEDWQKDRDVSPSKRADKSRVNHANGVERVTKIALEQEQDKDQEKDREAEQEQEGSPPPPAHPFSVMYSQKHRERTNGGMLKPIVHGRALSLEQKYGAEDCIQVAEIKGWDHDPSYYVGALEERKNGLQTTGNHARRSPGRGAGAEPDVTDAWQQYVDRFEADNG